LGTCGRIPKERNLDRHTQALQADVGSHMLARYSGVFDCTISGVFIKSRENSGDLCNQKRRSLPKGIPPLSISESEAVNECVFRN
jgi:hypothetical protein